MTRPKYETEKDLAFERGATPRIEAKFKCKLQKVPINYGFDWIMLREGKAFGCAEYKRRKVPRGQYPSVILSLGKFYKAVQIGKMLEAGFHFFVEFDDGLFYAPLQVEVDFLSRDFDIGWGGREDRNDKQDMEPVIHVPNNKFFRV